MCDQTLLGPLGPCEYLPRRLSQLRYEVSPRPGDYMDRMRAGWRRFGTILFHPNAPTAACASRSGCQATRPSPRSRAHVPRVALFPCLYAYPVKFSGGIGANASGIALPPRRPLDGIGDSARKMTPLRASRPPDLQAP
jgi:hypothetical protein